MVIALTIPKSEILGIVTGAKSGTIPLPISSESIRLHHRIFQKNNRKKCGYFFPLNQIIIDIPVKSVAD